MTVWTKESGPVGPEPFLERHPVLFCFWAVWNRLKYLQRLAAKERREADAAYELDDRLAQLREALA